MAEQMAASPETASANAAPADQPPSSPIQPRVVGPGAFRTSWKNFLGILLVVAALGYGWKVTQVDFVSLVVNMPKAERIFTGLVQPDVVAPVNETASASAP